LKNDDIQAKLSQFSFPAIIKGQIAIGSRKKAGLIKIAQNIDEAKIICDEIFGKVISNYPVEAILVEDLVDIKHEYYCSIALDSSSKKFFLIASAEGGIDIEEVAHSNPEAIIKQELSLIKGLSEETAKSVAEKLGLTNNFQNQAIKIFLTLWKIITEREAQLVEINPLVKTPLELIAVDGKMILDDNAEFRQPLTKKYMEKKTTELEKIARKFGFSFVELQGNIGILANGAGLTIALLDILAQNNLKPANFLDVGGGASKERVYEALNLILKLAPKSVLINIFGGITRCDIVAEAIVQTLEDIKNTPPIIIRLVGTKESEGREVLKKAGLSSYKSMEEAIIKLKEIMN